ncbi:hypothetical protein PACTADRAFT_75776 [Pachysolen tannophilus NRRL Y-2460]|uniref:Golgi apparatus membrane protein TVP38 n=1 Tax=Pachysolen tannophilus NRRL Y-2460 TaxID=669874 RepID=A0A1E4TU50_PACTA|nr:hypothetical protein PACTADRAFT_75776 [Pachysolen tannophilus NRRL Y-2460]
MDLLVSSARTWREMRGGKILMFVLIFGVSFPPLIGFSALSALTGMIWGISGGWPVLAAASITGSMFSFILFRYVLKERAVELMEKSRKFEAFTMILNDKNALWLLCLIRLCPLPYSLSNGALAAVPGISVPTFVGASVLTSPKLLIHLFIGSKIADLGESQDFATGLVDFASILITATAFSLTTYIIYIKMREKMQELGANATITLDEANFGIEDIDEGNGDDDSMFRDEDFEEDNIIV